MSNFHLVQPENFVHSPFQLIGNDWMLVTAKKDGKVNTMTASWGGMGVMWGKQVAYVVIRPQRYTKEFIDSSDEFSLSFLGEEHRKTLSYFGTVSGRDEDKIQKSGLSVAEENGVPYFDQSNTVLICKKLYVQEMKQDCFLDQALVEKWYPGSDYHVLYIAEIEKILEK